MAVKQIQCQGTPFEIGLSHGTTASKEVKGSKLFYSEVFQKNAELDWAAATNFALEYHPFLERTFPQYVEEMKGIAQGAGLHYEDILALNIRTEIVFGKFTDGCTSVAWSHGERSYLSQNWDWLNEQKQNLVALHIHPESGPRIKMITEAGVIGKIGLNELGVGVTLNAIKALGADFAKIPCHLALRLALESESRAIAVKQLQDFGVASACHILIADGMGSTGVECSARDVITIDMDPAGRIFHTNHYLVEHKGVVDAMFPADTVDRLERAKDLGDQVGIEPSVEALLEILKDEQGYPNSINRARREGDKFPGGTLFNIIMKLDEPLAHVRMGRPSEPDETFDLTF